jgi:hypothetical protein
MSALAIVGGVGLTVGAVGGFIVEHKLAGSSSEKAAAGDAWSKAHDEFLKDHPVPAGTRDFNHTAPGWLGDAAAFGGAGATAVAGFGTLLALNKYAPNTPTFAGFALAGVGVLGVGGLLGAGASYEWRKHFG